MNNLSNIEVSKKGFKAFRETHHLSKKQVAHKAGITRYQLNRIEEPTTGGSLESVVKLIGFYRTIDESVKVTDLVVE